jgi:hypothetical protein
MMERWNNGMMGREELDHEKRAHLLLVHRIPIFHYSNIPARAKQVT